MDMEQSSQPFSFGTMKQSAVMDRGTISTETTTTMKCHPLAIGRRRQVGSTQGAFVGYGRFTIGGRNSSLSAIQKADNTSCFVSREGVSENLCVELENMTEKPQMPEFKPLESLETSSLLEALISEPKVANSDFIYNKAMERLNMIKEDGTLDKYILSDEEAATLCAVPLLNESGLDFSEMVNSCKEKPPSKLFVLLLKSLRKLPQTRAVIYFGKANNRLTQRAKGSYLQKNFIVASRSMQTVKESLERENGCYKEIFSVEGGWGYNIGDFVSIGSKEGLVDDFIILEPWRVFSVADSGVKNEGGGTSVVPLSFVDERLLYEKEILLGMLQHIIPALEDPGYLKILSEMIFDNRNSKTIKQQNSKHSLFSRQPRLVQGTRWKRDSFKMFGKP